MPDKRQRVGRISTPPGQEATNSSFYIWIDDDQLIEATQLVNVQVPIPPLVRERLEIKEEETTLHAIVDAVYRRSSSQSVLHDRTRYGGDGDKRPPMPARGVTYAQCRVISQDPTILTSPIEDSPVYLSSENEMAQAYGYGDMIDSEQDHTLPIGLVKNGGIRTAGPAYVDLRYVLGENAGHVNVTGVAGQATKSSFLLWLIKSLLNKARMTNRGDPKTPPLVVRPIVFNVKGEDLMFIDFPNRQFGESQRQIWKHLNLGQITEPFTEAAFYAPSRIRQRSTTNITRPVADPNKQTQPYYWTLHDIIRLGLWRYLFTSESRTMEAMMALAADLHDLISESCAESEEFPLGIRLRSDEDSPQTFRELREYLQAAMRDDDHPVRSGGIHTFQSCRALASRIGALYSEEGATIFNGEGQGPGNPLIVVGGNTCDPIVIDCHALPRELMRFVVASVVDQVKRDRVGTSAIRGLKYVIMLDELNWFAPRSSSDEVTRLLEHVAAQLRSQGIILFGAQQHASQISPEILQNSDMKVLGRTGTIELNTQAWGHLLSSPEKQRAALLGPEEKMVLQGRFFGWMNIRTPFPAWAMKREHIPAPQTPPPGFDGE
jgi:uncharacterized protein